METLYTGHIHGFTSPTNISHGSTYEAPWGSQNSGLVALGVVLGSSISLVGLAFAFITYSLFSDLKSLAGTTLLSLLASLFMGQLLFVIGVGGIQDNQLCLSLSLALLYMKLASLCWLCCCCHQTLTNFRTNVNFLLLPEKKMGRRLASYSILSWGFPFLMVAVAAAFAYKEKVWHVSGNQILAQLALEVTISAHCWLMEGSAYYFGFLIPAIILLSLGIWFTTQGNQAAKISASLQVDTKTKQKIIKKRDLQLGLFTRLLVLISVIIILGAIASAFNTPELWAVYSIGQGVQGIMTAVLVTCNCKLLKLYTGSRGHKSHKKKYKSLRDCESSRFGVLSLTNPNYVTEETQPQHQLNDNNLSEMLSDGFNLSNVEYKGDIFVERDDLRENNIFNNAIVPFNRVVLNDDLAECLTYNEIVKSHPIESV